ncbi:MAG: NAD(P)-binding domain-containing protein, partial [Planctomycetes bacterium]|nr:NAD(P)-binding domain-containing protein [Planctomycetota bacterium]
MDWIALSTAFIVMAFVLAGLLTRRHALQQTATSYDELAKARERGSHRARLQHPKVDLAHCIGCGACVRACPEEGVLALAFGQAVVVHGARCVGHGLCAAACPTNAIALTLGDLKDRKDLPAIDAAHEAIGTPGLFLAGEITGFALVRTAVAHGSLVARAVAQRVASARSSASPAANGVLDLLVVGLGPAGVACMLAAKEAGLRALGVDQAGEIGGTVAAYPRKKLVMTQPMELPLHGRLARLEYQKEDLVELWQRLATDHDLAVRNGFTVTKVERGGGLFTVTGTGGVLRARNVCLAVGRRGSPTRLGVPGEDLPKVAYALLDAESYRDRAILVVGGGDSAIEAAVALADQPGNRVTLSYRKHAFSRLKARNEQRLAEVVAAGRIAVRYGTVVVQITADTVHLGAAEVDQAKTGGVGVAVAVEELPNDEVFVFAGGTPPFPLLEAAGVSFDPSLRPAEVATDRGTGLLVAVSLTGVGLAALLYLRHAFAAYYDLPLAMRSSDALHELLRPQGVVGLEAGAAAVVLFVTNLAYLARRAAAIGRWL